MTQDTHANDPATLFKQASARSQELQERVALAEERMADAQERIADALDQILRLKQFGGS